MAVCDQVAFLVSMSCFNGYRLLLPDRKTRADLLVYKVLSSTIMKIGYFAVVSHQYSTNSMWQANLRAVHRKRTWSVEDIAYGL